VVVIVTDVSVGVADVVVTAVTVVDGDSVVTDDDVIVDDVVADAVDVSVAIVGVAIVSDSFGARTTNFNSKDRLTTDNIIKMIKDMQMIAIQRRGKRICRSVFPV
jgi:hypothetical protein